MHKKRVTRVTKVTTEGNAKVTIRLQPSNFRLQLIFI